MGLLQYDYSFTNPWVCQVYNSEKFSCDRHRVGFEKASAVHCVRAVSKPHLFWTLGLAFERKADAPSYCKETKSEGTNGGLREVSALAEQVLY